MSLSKFNPHDVLRAIKVLKEDEKYIIIGFRHLQQNVQNMKTCKYDVNYHG